MKGVAYHAPNPTAAPGLPPLIGVLGVGIVALVGFPALLGCFAALAWASSAASALSARAGVSLSPAAIVALSAGGGALVLALFAFEFARRLDFSHGLRRAWMIWDTLRRTIFDSVIKPILWGAFLWLPATSLLGLILGWNQLGWQAPAVMAAVRAHIDQASAGACAFAAIVVGLRSLSDYVFDGNAYLVRTLYRFTPHDRETLNSVPQGDLRFYHALLRLAGAVAFACELVFQVIVFGLASWGLAKALPVFQPFLNAENLSPANSIAFWALRAFSLIDGPNVFGIASPLTANSAAWPFGLAIVFFKLFVLSLIVRLFQTSLNLRPHDISPSWGAALTEPRPLAGS